MTQTKQSAKQQQKQEAIALLRETLKPGTKVYTILRSVSRSGMTRHISTVIQTPDGILDITHYVAQALEYSIARDGGLVVGGCGMDMGFAVVYNLSRVLYPNGFETEAWGRDCRKCHTHVDGRKYTCPKCGSATTATYWRNEPLEFDKDGGYALKHQWM